MNYLQFISALVQTISAPETPSSSLAQSASSPTEAGEVGEEIGKIMLHTHTRVHTYILYIFYRLLVRKSTQQSGGGESVGQRSPPKRPESSGLPATG